MGGWGLDTPVVAIAEVAEEEERATGRGACRAGNIKTDIKPVIEQLSKSHRAKKTTSQKLQKLLVPSPNSNCQLYKPSITSLLID